MMADMAANSRSLRAVASIVHEYFAEGSLSSVRFLTLYEPLLTALLR
jgi:hypothetical protein